MATTSPIISLDDLKEIVEVRATVTKYDALMTSLILTATSQIEEATRRSFTSQARTEFFDSREVRTVNLDLGGDNEDGLRVDVSEQTIILDGLPVDTGATFEVFYDHTRAFLTNTLVNADNYLLIEDEGRVLLRFATRFGRRTIKINYTAGFAEAGGSLSASVPATLKLACQLQAAHLWTKTRTENIGVGEDRSQGSTGKTKFAVRAGLIPEVASLVRPYRKLLVGKG